MLHKRDIAELVPVSHLHLPHNRPARPYVPRISSMTPDMITSKIRNLSEVKQIAHS
jgi:hypothetical protein